MPTSSSSRSRSSSASQPSRRSLFQRLRQPVVLGYILAGLVVGPHVPIPLVADRKAHSARSLHDMMSAADPARRLLEMKMAAKAHSAQSLQAIMDAADPGKPE